MKIILLLLKKNCEQNIPATAFLWGYDSMGRPVDTLKNHEDLFTLELCLMITSPHLDTL